MPKPLDILFVDHLDSFSYNLVEAFERNHTKVHVFRYSLGSSFLLDQLSRLAPDCLVVLSPGPGAPEDASASIKLLQEMPKQTPAFGVCLGMQIMAQSEGGATVHAPQRVHGRSSTLDHPGEGMFQSIPSPMQIGRYHSLCVQNVKPPMHVVASQNEIPMAIQHGAKPWWGVQFHPESILTTFGETLLSNVMKLARDKIKKIPKEYVG